MIGPDTPYYDDPSLGEVKLMDSIAAMLMLQGKFPLLYCWRTEPINGNELDVRGSNIRVVDDPGSDMRDLMADTQRRLQCVDLGLDPDVDDPAVH